MRGSVHSFVTHVPFRIPSSLARMKVDFVCVLEICDGPCPEAECGAPQKIFRRRKRNSDGLMKKMRLSSQVQVVDRDHRIPRASGQGIVEEEILPSGTAQFPKVESAPRSSRLPMEYLVAGVSLVIGLFISVAVNIYLLIVIRKKFGNDSNEDNVSVAPSVQPETPFFTRPGRYDGLYDSSSFQHDSQWNRSRNSFRYGSDWNSPFTMSSRYEIQPEYTPVKWFGKPDNREILYPPMPIRHARSTRRSHSFRY